MRTQTFILFILSLTAFFTSLSASADELERAYQKEYAYLVAEKKALEKRFEGLEVSQASTLAVVQREIYGLQSKYLERKNKTDRLNQLIVDASRDADFSENDKLLLEATILQARESLSKLNLNIKETTELDKQLASAFTEVDKTINNDGLIRESIGKFFQANGSEVNGAIIDIGRVAKFGISDESSGALAPSGKGKFKIWDETSQESAQDIAAKANPENINIFLFDNADLAIEKQQEKSFSEDIKAGGLIGKVILFIGVIGAILIFVRITFLVMFSSDIQKTTMEVNKLIREQGAQAALKSCKNNVSSVGRVIAATLRNIRKERDHIEDIISEAILFESSKIDRFGSAILVIAAVSPLLGLLGTVTGMISTFDVITEFGTGDPKLLSTGISEALVTTKFGLIVAIPLLLVGNILSSWATRTKNGLERAALNVINSHKETLTDNQA